MVGPNDMSGSLERFLDLDDARLQKAIRRVFDVAHAAGIPTGDAAGGVQDIRKAVDLGCQLIGLGEDTRLLKDGADNVLNVFKEAMQ